jgi:hypothetical protein
VELVVVWALFALVATEIVVTYARVAPRELYHVSGSGIEGGLSRALVFVNFPTALVALAVIAFLYEQFPHKIIAAPAAVLCAVLLWPGVVSQANLDARPVNALPRRRPAHTRPHVRGRSQARPLDRSLAPPGLGTTHHHGMDGTLLVVTALLLSRRLGRHRKPEPPPRVAAYLALMFCYGIVNIANDFWIEQVVKRDRTRWEIPNVLEPRATIAWGLILLASLVLWVLWARLVDWGADEESPLRAEPDGLPARR